MKILFWLALIGVVATATAQTVANFSANAGAAEVRVATTTAQNAADFLAIAEDAEENDLDLDAMEKLEKDGTVMKHVKMLLSRDSVPSLASARFSDQPAAYEAVMRGTAAMFDLNSATNQVQPELRRRLAIFGFPTSLYYCPHRNYLLRWFLLYSGRIRTDICFVPWWSRQAITYAKCTTTTCRLNSPRTGRCRPSCYIRRRMLVICYNFRLRRWSWRWVVRNLPQACTCSSC